jgi:hypothetical protein
VEFAEFNARIDRGTPLTPVTLLLDRFHGIEPYSSPRPWQFMALTPAAKQVSAFFETAYPGHSQFPSAHPWKDPKEYGEMLRAGFDFRPYERRLVCPGRWPDVFEVLLTNAVPESFKDAQIIVALGPHDMRRVDAPMMRALVEKGRTLVCSAGLGLHFDFLPPAAPPGAPPQLLTVKLGKGQVLYFTGDCGLDPEGNLAPVIAGALDELIRKAVPFEIQGAPLQWSVNRTTTGYLVMLINHSEKAWWGTIHWKHGKSQNVRERWKEQAAVWRNAADEVVVKLGIPPYEPRVLEFMAE